MSARGATVTEGPTDDRGATRPRDLGSYIRDQRNRAELSLRHLAKLAGVSNPYLSQIERGLRRPSAEILQAIAKALRISAETLYVKAGILEERGGELDVEAAITVDGRLSDAQKQALLEMYRSFCHLTVLQGDGAPPPAGRIRGLIDRVVPGEDTVAELGKGEAAGGAG